jgi:heme oxygenase
MNPIAALRAATWASHQRLEKRLDVKARFSSRSSYRVYLEHLWGFCAALESHIGISFREALPDYETRRKLGWLTCDLVALGAEPTHVDLLPRCLSIPACADTAEAFGCMYVMEGATLGGQILLPIVESRLGLTATRGASFLASYGEGVSAMWRVFGAALDAWCFDSVRAERATVAAAQTFEALGVWLCDGPP